jgi:hypothetical protein
MCPLDIAIFLEGKNSKTAVFQVIQAAKESFLQVGIGGPLFF